MINPLVLEHALRRQLDIYQVPDELPLERRAELADRIMTRLIAESAGLLGLPAELPDHFADTSKMVLAELLREAIGEVPQAQSFPSRCDAALAGMEKGRVAAPAQDHIEQPRAMVLEGVQHED